jgi:DNA-binding HxlR family transcriptional regulator
MRATCQLVRRKSFGDFECSIARALEEIGDPWAFLILRHALLGARRFSDLEEALEIPASTLARRLMDLTERGLMTRTVYDERPPRVDYELTDKGRELLPIILLLADWGSRWASPRGAPLDLIDARTGKRVEPMLIDRRTGARLGPGVVALSAGPGASAELRSAVKAKRPVFGGAL